MRAVVLISSEPFSLDRLCSLYKNVGSTYFTDEDRLAVKTDSGFFAIIQGPDLDSELDYEYDDPDVKARKAEIERTVGKPHYALLEYEDFPAVNLAVGFLPENAKTLIDNNYDAVRPLAEIKRMISSGEDWIPTPVFSITHDGKVIQES